MRWLIWCAVLLGGCGGEGAGCSVFWDTCDGEHICEACEEGSDQGVCKPLGNSSSWVEQACAGDIAFDDGGGGGAGSCETFNDTTEYYGDVQLDSQCWTAGLHQACGDFELANLACDNLRGLEECCWSGGGSCPYC